MICWTASNWKYGPRFAVVVGRRAAEVARAAGWPLHDRRGALAQERVGLVAQRVPRAHLRGVRAADDRHRHDHRHDHGEAGAEAHDGLAVYPTPRTVWIRRGSPSASVLRRR